MLLQPVGTPGIFGVFSFSRNVQAQEVDPAAPQADEPKDAVTEEVKEEPAVEEKTETPTEETTVAEEVSTEAPTEEAVTEEAPVSEEIAPEEATEEEKTPETACLGSNDEVKSSEKGDWDTSEDGKVSETKEKVKLGVKYVFPGNEDVSVTFTCLPTDESKLDKLKIEEIDASEIQLPEGMAVASKYAYDITTDMKNGDFKYDIVLPKNKEVDDVKVVYVEKSSSEIKEGTLKNEDIKEVSKEDVKSLEDAVEVSDQDHFSFWFPTFPSKPDLKATKSHSGDVYLNQAFTWKIHVENIGNADAVFSDTKVILTDNLPSSGATYGAPTVGNFDDVSGTANIACSIDGTKNLICKASGGTVTIEDGGSFDITWQTTPTTTNDLKNPRNGVHTKCYVDPDWRVDDSDRSNNDCSETIKVSIQHTQVTFCHATPSDTAANGYNEITTDDDGVLSGHSQQHSADIIPPFDYYGGHFNGQNWDAAGEAILRNHCVPTGGLQVIKTVDDQSDLTQWSFQLDQNTPVQADASGIVDFGQVTTGAHTIAEIGPNTYTLNTVTGTGCTQTSNLTASATVVQGQTTTCTFSNLVNKGSITIIKDAQPDDAQDFSFTGGLGDFTLDDDADGTFSNTKVSGPLFPGAYSVTENATPGWTLAGVVCTSSNLQSLNSTSNPTQEITLAPGENVTCTFTNTKDPYCGDGVMNQTSEACDGTAGTTPGENFCTVSCTLKPIYDGPESCPVEKPVKKLVGTYSVDSKDADGISIPLTSGETYLFEASADFRPTTGEQWHSDAGYTSNDNWSSLASQYGIQGTGNDYAAHALLGDFGTGTVGVINWGDYDSSHTYGEVFTAPSNAAQFVIGDRYSDWFNTLYQNQSGMSDNDRSLTLDVYSCEEAKATVEVCKMDAQENPLPGWSVFLKGAAVETVNVDPDGNTDSSSVLPQDNYILEANGTYTYRPGTPGAEFTDANYSKRHPSDAVYGGPYVPWVNVNTFPSPHTGWLGVMVNGVATDWNSYFNPAHQYVRGYPNYSGQFDFKILDDVYSDNSGSIPVGIYKGYAGTTGEDGCVTFENVPLGQYSVGEVQQDGWEYVRGQGGVEVDSTDETFTIVNREVPRNPAISVEKTGSEFAAAGDPVTYNYAVTNTGDVPLSDVSVSDDKCSPVNYVSGDANSNSLLDLTETWSYTCSTTPTWAHNTKLTNTATATGTYKDQHVSDTDDFTLQSFILRKDVRKSLQEDFSDPNASFDVEVKKGSTVLGTVTISESGPAEMWLADSGSYQFCEVNVPAQYTPHYPNGCLTFVAGEGNYPDWSHINYVRPINVHATKIVCTDEADLPNWGHGGENITETTAEDWVGDHASCSFQNNWKFQWSLDKVGNPGDNNTADPIANWNTFGPTDVNGTTSTEIINPATSLLWFREVWKDNYIPFSHEAHPDNSDDVSAEFYCNDDVLNYDNWEWINTEPGGTYYCVAWNKAVEPDVEITKIDDQDPIISGNILTYTLTAKNNGVNPATDVVVTDTLPVNFQLMSVTPGAGDSCSDAEDVIDKDIQCELGTLAPNETAVIIVKGIALGVGTLENTAEVTNTNGDTNTENNSDTEETTVTEIAGVCRDNTTYANSVVAVDQGTLKSGASITDPTRIVPGYALGVPDSKFFSLGNGGSLVVKFTDPVIDVVGADLSFHETMNGRNSYPLEKADVSVSSDGVTFVPVGSVTSEPGDDGVMYLDFSSTGLPSIQYVKLVDTTAYGPHASNADGYDIEAIDAKCDSGTIVVKKETNPDKSDQSFSFDPSWGEDFSLTDGQSSSFNLLSGTYSVAETLPLPEGWDQTNVSCVSSNDDHESADNISLQPGETITCTFTNTQPITVVASKIVCDNESYLPNWGGGNTELIDGNTASNWLNDGAHPERLQHCALTDNWDFEWGPINSGDAGDAFTGPAGGQWNTFGPTVAGTTTAVIPGTVNLGGRIEMREVLQPDYLPFGYSNGNSDFSAEMYCTGDTVNYDNWEWINNPQAGQTYYCVAWNALKTGEITGFKWDDLNGNGQYDCSIDGLVAQDTEVLDACEQKLADWTIFIDTNNSGVLDSGEVSTATDSNGDYIFDDLIPGTYRVCEQQQTDWQQTYPQNEIYNCHDVTVGPGQTSGGNNFGNFHLGKVSGEKFEDLNGDGYTEGDSGLDGWTMVLGKSVLVKSVSVDSASDVPVDLGTFASGKSYLVTAEGTFDAGDFITGDAECSSRAGSLWNTFVKNYESYGETLLDLQIDGAATDWGGCNGGNVYSKIFAGDDASHNAFIYDVYKPNNSGSLTVKVYELTDVLTDVTSGGGLYDFAGLTAGDYALCEVQQSNWTQTAPTSACHWFTVDSGFDGKYDFANFHPGTITGIKFNDCNGDGKQGNGDLERSIDDQETCQETGLQGWTIYLDLDNNGSLDANEPSTITDENGYYSFTGLPVGQYIVREVNQNGWQQTTAMCGGPILTDNEEFIVQSVQLGGIAIESGSEETCSIGNYQTPGAQIFKTNNSEGPQLPGDIVTFRLEVTVLNNSVNNVELTDLPPEGFEYVEGSGEGAPFIKPYASPGIWDLGDMAAGETKIITYKAKISDTQDEGLYEDLAFAKGTSALNDPVLAEDPSDSDNFVGTQVAVALPETSSYTVPEVEVDRDRTETKKIVLGASTSLPMTGADVRTLLGIVALFLAGIALLALGRRKARATLAGVFLLAALLSFGSPAEAADSSLSVEMETPDAQVTSPDFKIGFVALDILDRPVTVECQVQGPADVSFSTFATPVLNAAGGNSGDCQVNAGVMPADGDYQFQVVATANDDEESSETETAGPKTVKLHSTFPGTPVNYNRTDLSCANKMEYTTAADGGKTVKVELYRSTSKTFVADASTKVDEQAIGSSQDGAFVNAVPDCNADYFYSIRAVDALGNGSGFTGDGITTVDTDIKHKKKYIEGAAATGTTGALAVSGAEAGAAEGGAVQGETTPEAAAGEAGSVLGEMTEESAAGGVFGENGFVSNHPWLTSLIILVILAGLYIFYRLRPRNA
ncbi:MAG: hypothetical protein A2808_04030 [Candidatus Moranbacteria bacterium RIFCSPHIGHO2_01_FULL_55_24]|nr:MAG: hypothetical protein A2808_04030 [Candidatus Moranbacteria bacterium RIFCSPHIGHO2_01_FULL_55_24]